MPAYLRFQVPSDRFWHLATFALFVIGILLRAFLYFPVAAFPADSDAVGTGLCAFQIQDGNLPFFAPGGVHHGSASCYLTAMFFALVGPSRVSLALTGLTFEALLLACMFLFLREVLDACRACIAYLFVAVPSMQFITVTYVPWYYVEVMVGCSVVLWLAARWRNSATPWTSFLFGLACGFTLWLSLVSVMVIGPATLWVASRRRAALVGEAWPCLVGLIAGFSPWLIYNAQSQLASLNTVYTKPAVTFAQFADNFLYAISYDLPMLLFDGSAQAWGLVSTALLCAFIIIFIGYLLALGDPISDLPKSENARTLGALALLIIVSAFAMKCAFIPGSFRGWTVRYLSPIYLMVPPLAGIGLVRLWQLRPFLAVLPASTIFALNPLLYSLPGTDAREVFKAQMQQNTDLQRFLTEAGIGAVIGDYWLVYHINFDSQRRIAGIPLELSYDYLSYASRLPEHDLRWVLLAHDAKELSRRAQLVGATGTISTIGDLKIFVPQGGSNDLPTSELLKRVTKSL